MNTVNCTVPRPPGRRAVRRRSDLDEAWSTALAEIPVELHEPVRKYAETARAAYEARQALSAALAGAGTRWRDVDAAVTSLVYRGTA